MFYLDNLCHVNETQFTKLIPLSDAYLCENNLLIIAQISGLDLRQASTAHTGRQNRKNMELKAMLSTKLSKSNLLQKRITIEWIHSINFTVDTSTICIIYRYYPR